MDDLRDKLAEAELELEVLREECALETARHKERVRELEAQLDAAGAAEDMVVELSARNQQLDEEARELRAAVAHFEELREVDAELEQSEREAQRELQEQLAAAEGAAARLQAEAASREAAAAAADARAAAEEARAQVAQRALRELQERHRAAVDGARAQSARAGSAASERAQLQAQLEALAGADVRARALEAALGAARSQETLLLRLVRRTGGESLATDAAAHGAIVSLLPALELVQGELEKWYEPRSAFSGGPLVSTAAATPAKAGALRPTLADLHDLHSLFSLQLVLERVHERCVGLAAAALDDAAAPLPSPAQAAAIAAPLNDLAAALAPGSGTAVAHRAAERATAALASALTGLPVAQPALVKAAGTRLVAAHAERACPRQLLLVITAWKRLGAFLGRHLQGPDAAPGLMEECGAVAASLERVFGHCQRLAALRGRLGGVSSAVAHDALREAEDQCQLVYAIHSRSARVFQTSGDSVAAGFNQVVCLSIDATLGPGDDALGRLERHLDRFAALIERAAADARRPMVKAEPPQLLPIPVRLQAALEATPKAAKTDRTDETAWAQRLQRRDLAIAELQTRLAVAEAAAGRVDDLEQALGRLRDRARRESAAAEESRSRVLALEQQLASAAASRAKSPQPSKRPALPPTPPPAERDSAAAGRAVSLLAAESRRLRAALLESAGQSATGAFERRVQRLRRSIDQPAELAEGDPAEDALSRLLGKCPTDARLQQSERQRLWQTLLQTLASPRLVRIDEALAGASAAAQTPQRVHPRQQLQLQLSRATALCARAAAFGI